MVCPCRMWQPWSCKNNGRWHGQRSSDFLGFCWNSWALSLSAQETEKAKDLERRRKPAVVLWFLAYHKMEWLTGSVTWPLVHLSRRCPGWHSDAFGGSCNNVSSRLEGLPCSVQRLSSYTHHLTIGCCATGCRGHLAGWSSLTKPSLVFATGRLLSHTGLRILIRCSCIWTFAGCGGTRPFR